LDEDDRLWFGSLWHRRHDNGGPCRHIQAQKMPVDSIRDGEVNHARPLSAQAAVFATIRIEDDSIAAG
jgi:hypothetical protein